MMLRKAVAPRVSASSMRTSLKSFCSQMARMALPMLIARDGQLVAHGFNPLKSFTALGSRVTQPLTVMPAMVYSFG
jgi:hypothetical protein